MSWRDLGWAFCVGCAPVVADPLVIGSLDSGAADSGHDATSDAGTDSGADVLSDTPASCTPEAGGGAYSGERWACAMDVDADGEIGLSDLLLVQNHAGCAVGTGDELCDRSDLSGDCSVDGSDLALILANFGFACADAAAVPSNWPCAADVNGDGVVKQDDRALVVSLQGCEVSSPQCSAADVTRDGVVDTADHDAVDALIGRSCL